MKIRFLTTVPSETLGFPFQAGQVIDVPAPSDFLLAVLASEQAEVVPTDETERAVAPVDEQPEPVRMKGRRRGGV